MWKLRGVHFVLLLCVCMRERARAANILYLSTTTSPSHNIWDRTLAMALRDRGHHITYVTHAAEKHAENFTAIIFEGIYEKIAETYGGEYDFEDIGKLSVLENIHMLYDWVLMGCSYDLQTNGFKQLLQLAQQGVSFDLIIFDITSGICNFPLVDIFGRPPLVATSPFGITPAIASNFGIDLHTSYIPHLSLSYTQNMNFLQRFANYFIHLYDMSVRMYYSRKTKALLDKTYGRDMSHVFEVEKNFSLLLPNYDPVLDYPRALPPDVIPVGGLHTRRAKALPKDLQKYLDNSKDGVIMFSLGTNIRSDQLKHDKRQVILEALSRLQQNVIWKFESDIKNLPKNVIVRNFLPQNDIMAHRNVKLLINHGGSLSTQEAMYHGIPLVTIPFFLDQYTISSKIISRNLGKTLNFNNLTVHGMIATIREVLENPIYAQRAKQISECYHDRPDNPLQRAVFWVEHVLRRGGTDAFRTPLRTLPFCHKHHLDIWGAIAVVIITLYIVIARFCCKSTNKTTHKLKTK